MGHYDEIREIERELKEKKRMSDGLTDRRSEPTERLVPRDAGKVNSHIDFLDHVAKADVEGLRKAEKQYGSSWKRRGGVGAFMMLARKWDRLENALRESDNRPGCANAFDRPEGVAPWDIFGAVRTDTRPEGIIDDIRDLRRYLILVEAEMMARGVVK